MRFQLYDSTIKVLKRAVGRPRTSWISDARSKRRLDARARALECAAG